MKNITVSVDDGIYRRARVRAAELDTSVSALVRKFLTDFGGAETEFDKLAREEVELRKQVKGFSASDRLSREEVHERRRERG